MTAPDHLSTIVEERYPALVAYARLLTGGRLADAEDLVQDAIVATFARRRAFDSAGHAEGYVRRCIANGFVDAHRTRLRRWRADARAASPEAVAPPQEALHDAADVARALAVLSPRERACVVLRHFDDLTVREVGHRLGIAEGSVKRYLHDAARRLGVALAERHDEPVRAAAPAEAASPPVTAERLAPAAPAAADPHDGASRAASPGHRIGRAPTRATTSQELS